MLFDILKLFGLDVRAKIVQARTEFEQRVELAKSRIARTLTTASVLAVVFAMAALAGLAAVGVGLSALYSWVSIHHGQFYGYAAVGGVLVIISATLSAIGILEARSWSAEPTAPHLNEKLARGATEAQSRSGTSPPPIWNHRSPWLLHRFHRPLRYSLPIATTPCRKRWGCSYRNL